MALEEHIIKQLREIFNRDKLGPFIVGIANLLARLEGKTREQIPDTFRADIQRVAIEAGLDGRQVENVIRFVYNSIPEEKMVPLIGISEQKARNYLQSIADFVSGAPYIIMFNSHLRLDVLSPEVRGSSVVFDLVAVDEGNTLVSRLSRELTSVGKSRAIGPLHMMLHNYIEVGYVNGDFQVIGPTKHQLQELVIQAADKLRSKTLPLFARMEMEGYHP